MTESRVKEIAKEIGYQLKRGEAIHISKGNLSEEQIRRVFEGFKKLDDKKKQNPKLEAEKKLERKLKNKEHWEEYGSFEAFKDSFDKI